MEGFDTEFIRGLVTEGKSYKFISETLKQMYPHTRGFSERSVRRFCNINNISYRSGLGEQELNEAVSNAVQELGPTYGRKMLKGYFQSRGSRVSQRRLSEAAKQVAPQYHRARVNDTARLRNPVPYQALYFGHKLHCDQNEKLVDYGVTHVCAIDGHSLMVVGFATMPIKNNITIYESLFRDVVQKYGLWDQVRTDHGREFYLMLAMQEHLAHLRNDPSRDPHRQTTSKKNLPVERFWKECNQRVNYPVKLCLNHMVESGLLQMENQCTKFCVSAFTRSVVEIGIKRLIGSWNNRPANGRRTTPTTMMSRNNRTARITPDQIPHASTAVQLYESHGGRLNRFGDFGIDPLMGNPMLLRQREEFLLQNIVSYEAVFNHIVNGNTSLFERGLRSFISFTNSHEQ